MRIIESKKIEKVIYQLFLDGNYIISPDILCKMRKNYTVEKSGVGKTIIKQIIDNYEIAAKERVALCQDCGMAIVFAKIGQDVHIVGDFNEAIQLGVRRAYRNGYLRKSVVKDPLFGRVNTKDNTPAIIHTVLVPGDKIILTAVVKGFGSENCSQMKIFLPSASKKDVQKYVVKVAKKAGPNVCPPMIVGVGIGGTIEKAALLAKKASIRPIDIHNQDPRYASLERDILDDINETGIGPGGLGGKVTALKVNIEAFATHIASMPVVVNLCCHASRHVRAEL